MSAIARLVRLAASAVVAGLVIGACGPPPEPEAGGDPATGDAGTAGSGTPDQQSASASVDLPGDLRMTLTVSGVVAGEPIQFTLGLANEGAAEAVLDFSDGQRFDFEVFDADASVWRWASDLFFPQMLGRERIAPGESMEWSGRLEEGLPSGNYTVRATLTTSARPTVELEFTIEG